MPSLDATSANRTMWKTKEHPQIIYIDIEEELEFKPTKIMDCTRTDFKDKSIPVIWFDPPQIVGGKKNGGIYAIPSKKVFDEKYPKYKQKHPRYYGSDKFKNKEELMNFLNKSALEFHRILQDDGILMVKWAEVVATTNDIIPLFSNFIEMMRIPIKSVHKTTRGSFWIVFMKDFKEV